VRTRDYRVILGATIREQRRRARLTLENLSEKADLHPNYLGRVERGEEYISLAALMRVAKALRVRVRRLVSDL
jgi:transcriptional regulator with XRE-family HTH domain